MTTQIKKKNSKNVVIVEPDITLITVIQTDILGVRIRLKKLMEEIAKISLELKRISDLLDLLR